MRFSLRLLAISAIPVLGLAASWEIARVPGAGCWPPRCEANQVPLATPVVEHAGRLFMIGDGAAPLRGYESSDGKAWSAFTHDAGWGARYKAADASFAGALWRVGGWVESGGRRTAMNDVWRSEDGRHWQRLLERAPWSPRSGAHLVAFRDTLWLVGGEPNDQRLWLTADGQRWISRQAGSLPRGNPQGVLVFDNSLWILGHGSWNEATNDVWTSTDGATWTRVLGAAPWQARTGAGFAVVNHHLWVIAGAGLRDAWSSSDGRAWRRETAELPGPPRSAEYSVVFRNAVWIFGGKTGGAGGTGFWDGVVFLRP